MRIFNDPTEDIRVLLRVSYGDKVAIGTCHVMNLTTRTSAKATFPLAQIKN